MDLAYSQNLQQTGLSGDRKKEQVAVSRGEQQSSEIEVFMTREVKDGEINQVYLRAAAVKISP